MLSPCCPNSKCGWGQVDRTEVCPDDRAVECDHTVGRYGRISDSGDHWVLMDINQLEEQYDSMRQRQKEQTHVVFGSGVIKHARRDLFNPPIKTVSVNCSVDKPPALDEDLPVNNIMLAFPNKDYVRDSETPWHIHLDIHRMLLAQKTGRKSQVEADERSDVQSPQLPVVSRGTSDEGDTSDDDQKSNGDATAVSSCKANELKKTFHSLYRYNHHIPQINKRFSFPNERSNIWASKNGHVTRISPITKGDYYPFPHMKTPRKSDTAKGLGLYNKY
ncbi:uncharacterized protein [Hemitrygon akajei]|uniref:uncharacterized protein n=1 Tax=Hemitrygon akajei TaxID=2704970 RepID=UPI003BF98584